MGKGKLSIFFLAINRYWFLLYVFFVPFLYFSSIKTLSPLTYPLDFFVSAIGFVLAFVYCLFFNRSYFSRDFGIFILIPLILMIDSFCVSSTQFYTFGTTFGTDTIKVAFKNSLFILHFFFLCFYCHFGISVVTRKEFLVVFLCSFFVMILLGFVQILVIQGDQIAISIYDFLSKTRVIRPTDYYTTWKRISMSAPEPAWTAGLSFVYFLPVSFMFISIFRKRWESFLLGLFDVCLIALEVVTKSTEVYVTLLVVVGVFFLFFFIFCFKNDHKILGLSTAFLFLVGSFVIFKIPQFQTTVLKKLTIGNNINPSTACRLSYVYNALLVFLHNPVLGVGNGVQGFYYFDNIVNTIFESSSEVRAILLGEVGIETFAPFVFYVLSGYGLFGALLFGLSAYKFLKQEISFLSLRDKRFYLFGFFIFIFLGLFTENIISNYYFPLFLSVPFLFRSQFAKSNWLETSLN